jgi:hypothetical protein
MGTIFKEIKNFVKPSSGVFVEIGSERGEGSTHELDRLAKLHGTKLISVDISDSAKNRYQTQLPDVEFVVAPAVHGSGVWQHAHRHCMFVLGQF